MGRPIKKKFFANLNSPYQNHATGGPTGEGGEGVASVTINTVGSYTSALPGITFGTPDLYSGVQATGVVHGKALSAVATAKGTGYRIGDIVTQTNGATGTFATFRVTALKVISVTLVSGGTNYDNDNNIVFDSADWGTPLTLDVTGNSGGVLTTFNVTSYGVWTGAGVAPTTLTAQMSNTRDGVDQNAAGAVFTIVYGIETVAVQTEGDYTVISSGAKATSVNAGPGASATLTITYGVKSVEITNPGSHYISAADANAQFSTGAAAGTAVLASIADNGLAAYAHIHDGVEGSIVDIMKQEASRRYLVKERDGKQGQCRLVARNPGNLYAGEMCLIATDTQGCTYWVTKLTARRAYLKQRTSSGTGYQFADGSSAGWNITTAVTGKVSIATV